jgi:uncharacterized damage-inducible protein DinB
MNPELLGLLSNYQLSRAILLSDLKGLSTETVDWSVAPGAVTIGSSLLHIIGFEHLLIAAVEGKDVQWIIQQPGWQHFTPGFPRELNVSPPRGLPLDHYRDLLAEQEKLTIELLESMSSERLSLPSIFYADRKAFREDGLEKKENRQLLIALLQHEQYHRGQITLLKHLFGVLVPQKQR